MRIEVILKTKFRDGSTKWDMILNGNEQIRIKIRAKQAAEIIKNWNWEIKEYEDKSINMQVTIYKQQ